MSLESKETGKKSEKKKRKEEKKLSKKEKKRKIEISFDHNNDYHKEKKINKKDDKVKMEDDRKDHVLKIKAEPTEDDLKIVGGRIISLSAQQINNDSTQLNSTTLLLFYQV